MVDIREAKLTDLDELLVLLPQLSSRSESSGAQVPPRDAAEAILVQICADNRTNLLVAVEPEQHRLLGAVTLVIISNLTYAGRPWAMIENVVVAQTKRRQGIGRRLVQEAVRLAKSAGCYKVQLISGTKPEQITFYHQLGFQSETSVGYKLYL